MSAQIIRFPRENRQLEQAWLDLCSARWRLRHFMEGRPVEDGEGYLDRMRAVAEAEWEYGRWLGRG